MTHKSTERKNLPAAIYVWIVPSEQVLDQPGSWRIRKWDTEPFPEANFTLQAAPEVCSRCRKPFPHTIAECTATGGDS